jgi:hypothetical protein
MLCGCGAWGWRRRSRTTGRGEEGVWGKRRDGRDGWGFVLGLVRESGGVAGAVGRWGRRILGWVRQSGGVALLNHRLQAGTSCGVRFCGV